MNRRICEEGQGQTPRRSYLVYMRDVDFFRFTLLIQ